MKKIIVAAGAVLTISMGACQLNYDKTVSGLTYKIFPANKTGEKLAAGKFVKFNISFTVPEKKDTVLSSTFGKTPGYIQVDTSKRAEYSFMEVMSKCSVGDSGVVVLSVDSLKNKGAIQDYNEIFTQGGTIMCRFRVMQTFKSETEVTADYQKEMDIENKRQVKSIEDYMTKKGIKGEKTKNGAYVAIENPGDVSMKADSGKVVSIKYKGYLQENGKVFDTNLDTSHGHAEPIQVTIGRHGVIPGWEEALPYFGKGGKGKILVPAFLGYGANGAPPDIPGNANLVFEVQILDVTQAPAATVPGGRKGLPNQNDSDN